MSFSRWCAQPTPIMAPNPLRESGSDPKNTSCLPAWPQNPLSSPPPPNVLSIEHRIVIIIDKQWSCFCGLPFAKVQFFLTDWLTMSIGVFSSQPPAEPMMLYISYVLMSRRVTFLFTKWQQMEWHENGRLCSNFPPKQASFSAPVLLLLLACEIYLICVHNVVTYLPI